MLSGLASQRLMLNERYFHICIMESMKTKRFTNYLLLVLVVVTLFSCNGVDQSIATQQCLKPNLVTIPSPIPQTRDIQDGQFIPELPDRKPMPSWWEPQWNWFQRMRLPERWFYFGSENDVIIFGDEVWIGYFKDLVRYNPKSGEISTYQLRDLGNYFGYAKIEDLFVTSDQVLWVGLDMREDNSSALARYNPEKDMLELVADQDGLLESGKVHIIAQSSVHEYSDRQLVFVLNESIIMYDIKSNQAQMILGIEQGFKIEYIDISTDGHIWFMTRDDFSVRELDPVTGMIWDYGEPPSITEYELERSFAKRILSDSQGRVWAAPLGWLEPDQNTHYRWHSIKNTPILVDIYATDVIYDWSGIGNLYESSDGRIWLSTGVGIVAYDPNNQLWCWSASTASLVVEDQSGYLWIVGDRQIYKYNLQSK